MIDRDPWLRLPIPSEKNFRICRLGGSQIISPLTRAQAFLKFKKREDQTMQYMLIFRETAEEVAKREDPAHAEKYWAAWHAYIGSLNQAGVVISGNGLQPPHTSTTVRIVNGKRQVQDGPYPDAKEHLGGYFVIEVPDLDAALEWAGRSPNVHNGSTEVRPVMGPAPQA